MIVEQTLKIIGCICTPSAKVVDTNKTWVRFMQQQYGLFEGDGMPNFHLAERALKHSCGGRLKHFTTQKLMKPTHLS